MYADRNVIIPLCVVFHDTAGRRGVVQMAVGEDDRFREEVHRLQPLNEHLRICPGIDDNAFLLAGRDDIRIGVH